MRPTNAVRTKWLPVTPGVFNEYLEWSRARLWRKTCDMWAETSLYLSRDRKDVVGRRASTCAGVTQDLNMFCFDVQVFLGGFHKEA